MDILPSEFYDCFRYALRVRDNSVKTEMFQRYLKKYMYTNKCIKHLYKEFTERNMNIWFVMETILYFL